MKVKLNDGTEIECTLTELIELKKAGLISGTQPVQKSIIIKQPEIIVKQPEHKKYHHINWPENEDNILREFYINRKRGVKLKGKEYRMLCSILAHRTKTQISARAENLGLTKITGLVPKKGSVVVAELPGMGKIKAKRKTSEWNKAQSDRFSFMGKRMAYYMKQYNWGREKASQQSAIDWNNNKGIIAGENKVQVKNDSLKIVEFPKFHMLSEIGNKTMEEITKNIIGIGGSITYKEIQYVPLAINGGCWTVTLWKEFVNEFITKSEQIADSFFKPNRFKMIVGENNFITIRYLA
jgi:hypothetical protein